jgi:splicing factor U2AF 65 kDa subunit
MITNLSDSESPKKKAKSKTQDPEYGLMKRELLRKLKLKQAKKKLVVSSIPLDSTPEQILLLFNTTLVTLNPGPPPVTSIVISEDKTHAILEFKNKQDVINCMLLDGIELRGRKLKVQKHKAYISARVSEMKKEIREKEKRDRETEEIFNCNIFPTHDNRIFMGNLPTNLPEEDIRRIVESFGHLKNFSLVKTSAVSGQSRGFCFFEYWDGRITDKAIEQLNQIEIGDKKIKVQRATQGKSNLPMLTGPMGHKRKKFSEGLFRNGPSGMLAELTATQLQQIQACFAVPIHALAPSRCLCMVNMFSPQDLVDDSEFRDIYSDVWQECQKHGLVENIVICRPNLDTMEIPINVGKVYVKFFELVSAKRAKYFLAGRTFSNRTVIISFYPEQWFVSEEFN